MDRITPDSLATMDLRVSWRHGGIAHTDCLHARRVNIWRDVFPAPVAQAIMDQPRGAVIRLDFDPGAILPPRNDRAVHRVAQRQFASERLPGAAAAPAFGRFYPCGLLDGIPGVFRENIQPFRVTALDAETITADLNHPLSGRPLGLTIEIRNVRPKFEEHGGTAVDWLELALAGPGMQARVNGRPTDFFRGSALERQDETEDRDFYRSPRLVNHLDDTAIGVVSGLYGELLSPWSEVLDLMGSWVSHLPDGLALGPLTVLGMNREELEANPRASARLVHDLNRTPELPFGDGRFGAVLCAVSVEYLIQPARVFAEVARVLEPGGLFIVSVSNRWFPPKVIRVWPALHEFERVGMILEYFLDSGQYTELQTCSMRGLPRPPQDKYYGRLADSDPVYAVWGRKG